VTLRLSDETRAATVAQFREHLGFEALAEPLRDRDIEVQDNGTGPPCFDVSAASGSPPLERPAYWSHDCDPAHFGGKKDIYPFSWVGKPLLFATPSPEPRLRILVKENYSMFKRLFIVLLLIGIPVLAAKNPRLIHRQNPIPNEYIVVLEQNIPYAAVDGLARSLAAAYGGTVEQVWKDSLKAFHFIGTEAGVESIFDDPRVMYAEENAITYMNFSSQPGGTEERRDLKGKEGRDLSGQEDALIERVAVTADETFTPYWHLDRLDDFSPILDYSYNMNTEGRSVYAYVIDAGVVAAHPEFEGRVGAQLDFSPDKDTTGLWSNDRTEGCTAGSFVNQHAWHGTAVASLITGRTVGAARPQIVSLKVMRCSDYSIRTSDVFRAIDFIPSEYNPWRHLPGVINYSGFVVKGDVHYSVIRDAVRNTVSNTGFPFFTSADNWSGDACQFSPNYDAYTSANPWGRTFVVGGTELDGSMDIGGKRPMC
jgi:hypothetical protein